ncbi:MAG: hypothetical protein P1V35_05595, partial [Planctomycetota bacterium]|nr:hypothetical protein [Planctomycetota bacterium]
MKFTVLRYALPAALALVTLVPSSMASTAKADWNISLGSRDLGITIGSPGHPRARTRTRTRTRAPQRSRCITPARGHWKTITEQVWVEGRTHKEWVPARYETVLDSRGGAHRVLVCEGHYRTVREPGHYESRS